jgi:hypothetical protein
MVVVVVMMMMMMVMTIMTFKQQYKVVVLFKLNQNYIFIINFGSTKFCQNIYTYLHDDKNGKGKRYSHADMKGCRP